MPRCYPHERRLLQSVCTQTWRRLNPPGNPSFVPKNEPRVMLRWSSSKSSSSQQQQQGLRRSSLATSNQKTRATPWQVLRYFGMGLILPSIPIGAWWYQAYQERQKRLDEVETKIRFTTVQTLDELMIEKCLPGDVVLFDRRCDCCAAGPFAAFSCWLSHKLLCNEHDPSRTIDYGNFNHCGM